MSLSPHQSEQLEIALSAHLGILTGSAGTGKSHTLAHLLSTLPRGSYFVATPTGKAAARLNEELACGAMTIHSLLGVTRNGHDGDGWNFFHNEDNPLTCEWLFLDEAFMVDVPTLASLLRAVRPGTRVLLTGDPHQLAPVGHGRPVYDMLQSGCVPHGHLSEIWRYAGRIARVANAIKDGAPWQPSPTLDVDAQPPENYRHLECRNSLQALQTVEAVLQRLVENRGYNALRDVQVICWLNDAGSASRKALNKQLQQLLNPTGETRPDIPWRLGDKIMCLRNHFRKTDAEHDPLEGDGGSEVYLANGEIGYVTGWVWSKGKSSKVVGVRARFCGQEVQIQKGKKGFDIFDLAYAVTCHKFQGAQSKVVIAIADDGADRVASRQGWYTALTRASEILLTVGRMQTIQRQCQRLDIAHRKTFLQQLLQERLPDETGIADATDLLEI